MLRNFLRELLDQVGHLVYLNPLIIVMHQALISALYCAYPAISRLWLLYIWPDREEAAGLMEDVVSSPAPLFHI